MYAPEWARTKDEIVFEGSPLSNINNSAIYIVSLANPANPAELTATFNVGAVSPSWASILFSNLKNSRSMSHRNTVQPQMAIITTVVQLFMSFALGWVAKGAGLIAAYSLLALLYTGATVSAIRARQLFR